MSGHDELMPWGINQMAMLWDGEIRYYLMGPSMDMVEVTQDAMENKRVTLEQFRRLVPVDVFERVCERFSLDASAKNKA